MKKFSFIIIATFLLITSNKAVAQVIIQDEFNALVALYNATDGANWTNTTSGNGAWNIDATDRDVSGWFGITTDGEHVTQLILENNNLEGDIPSEIGNFENLTELNISQNTLTGNIPTQIGQLGNLQYLYLQDNQLDSIPEELGYLTNLIRFYAHRSTLSGQLPQSIGGLVNLTHLKLSENNLSGEIPEGICDLTALKYLQLQINNFSGELPANFGNLTQLELLHLCCNDLSGTLPPEMGNFNNLEKLYLYDNDFTGAIPAGFSNSTELTTIRIYRNRFDGLPDLSTLPISSLWVQENNLTFEDIILNLSLEEHGFSYSSQNNVGEAQSHQIPEGSSYTLSVTVGGAGNTYQWYKDGQLITGATSADYIINSFSAADVDPYHCMIDNPQVNITLESEPFTLSLGPAQEDPIDIGLPQGSTGDLSLGSIPGTGTLAITDLSGAITNFQFDVDEDGNISNVQMEVEGRYIPMHQDFFTTSQGLLNIVNTDNVCLFKFTQE